MKIISAVLVFFISSWVQAKTRIAFLERYDHLGHRVQYEPGGRFVHTALQFEEIGNQWLHAYPGDGVAVISLAQLKTHGVIAEVIELPYTVTREQVLPYMGKPFDFYYSWSDDAIYCSELIGKLLQVPTQPMSFNRQHWPSNYWALDGKPGLSPDKLWKWAQAHESQ